MSHLVHIGNSFGVRIPKAIIQQVGFKKNTNLVFKVTEEGLLIAPEHQAREGWENKFKSSKKKIKSSAMLGEFPNEFDEKEWKW